MSARRRNHYDVTNTVQVSHPEAVCAAVCAQLEATYPEIELDAVREGFRTFTRLYAGTLPGYLGCDTWYHDAQHSLDCTLAMARLIDGHERAHGTAQRLGARRAVLGILIALFHDAGYIRRGTDQARYGAEFTLTHVRRSGEFLADFLPRVGYASAVPLARQVVHFTGYEVALDKIRVAHPKDRMLGFLLGTADVLAQTADRCYLEKCRDFLYREFELCGLAGHDNRDAVYHSARDLLEKTVSFNRKLWDERLDGYFGGVHRYLDVHFGAPNPYSRIIDAHLQRIGKLTRTRRLGELRLKPTAITAQQLRRQLGLATTSTTARAPAQGRRVTASAATRPNRQQRA